MTEAPRSMIVGLLLFAVMYAEPAGTTTAGAEPPKVFSREEVERLNAENMPKRLTGGEDGGII